MSTAADPPSVKLRVRRKPLQKTSGVGRSPEAVPNSPASLVVRSAPVSDAARADSTANTPPASEESLASTQTKAVGLLVQHPTTTSAALILPKRQSNHAGAMKKSSTTEIVSAPPRLKATPPPAELTATPRPSIDRATIQRLSHDEQARVAPATVTATRATEARPPVASASELHTQGSLAPQPSVVWRKSARQPVAGGDNPGASGGGIQLVRRQVDANASVPFAGTSGAHAGTNAAVPVVQPADETDAGLIAEQVMRDIARRLVVERERRGLRN
jgi:hypothetical protein